MPLPLLDPSFARNWRRFLRQSGLATAALVVAILAADFVSGPSIARAVIVASVGSTAFVLFITPHSESATGRHVIGGHALGLLIGALFSFTAESFFPGGILGEIDLLTAVVSAIAVGVAMLAMAASDTEHPPAAGTVLAIAAQGFDWGLAIFLATAVIGLALVHAALRRSMIDLF